MHRDDEKTMRGYRPADGAKAMLEGQDRTTHRDRRPAQSDKANSFAQVSESRKPPANA